MTLADHDKYSKELLAAISEDRERLPPLDFVPNPAQSRNAAKAMTAIICHRLSNGLQGALRRSGKTYEWTTGVFNSRNIADRDYFWTNMRRGVASEMHDNAASKAAAYLFACCKQEETSFKVWAIPEPIVHECLTSLVFEEDAQKYIVQISTEKQRFDRYDSSPDLAPYFRSIQLLPDELHALKKSRQVDDGVKRERRNKRRDDESPKAVILELTRKLDEEGAFDPEGATDARERILSSVVRRRGQPAFRDCLLAAYQMRCAISGCDFVPVLEAAHITPYLVVRFINNVVVSRFLPLRQRKLLKSAATHVLANLSNPVE